MFKIRFILIAILFLNSVFCGEFLFSDSRLSVKSLSALKPLPKIHYSFPLPKEVLSNKDDPRLYELARITHAISLSGEWATQSQVDVAVFTCQKVIEKGAKTNCRIGINYSPWHRYFGKDLPPTDRGESYKKELEMFAYRLNKIKNWIQIANRKYKSQVSVGAILLDSERFFIRKDDKKWNTAIKENLDSVHDICVKIFPEARIEWYGRGMRPESSGDGWGKTPLFTGLEKMASLSCSLYSIPEIHRMQELFRRTATLADQYEVKDVTPWVALASGYRRGSKKPFYWDMNWDYDTVYSWSIGAQLNINWYGDRPERFSPFRRAKIVIFYPCPYDKRVPSWEKHFVAYVKGATGVKLEEGDGK